MLPEANLVEMTTAEAEKDEMLKYFKQMYTVRRMEIACDTEYKARNIRGFCHLYDGQEAIAVGLQSALSKDDDVISSYRCHALQLLRGSTVTGIVGELFGKELGSSMGKVRDPRVLLTRSAALVTGLPTRRARQQRTPNG